MYKRIDLTKLAGYPLAQEDLDWLQKSYRDTFAAMAGLAGDKVILAGMTELGGNVTAGWISINNEIVPFLPGAIGTGQFIIDEVVTPLVFDDGASKDVLYERVAKFSGIGTYNYADLRRLGTLRDMWVAGDIKMKHADAAYIAANFDVNGYGLNADAGWRILSKAYPASAGKTFVNIDPIDPDFDNVGDVIGEKKHTLIIDEMPSHSHGETPKRQNDSDRGVGNASFFSVDNVSTIYSGGDQAHNNLQPSYAILTLIKL